MREPGDSTIGASSGTSGPSLARRERHEFLPAGSLGSSGLARALLDSMTEGVSIAAEDGTIIYTNPAEDRMFGYGPGELTGQSVAVQNAYPPEENARIVAEVIGELQRSGAWQGEWLNKRKDGTSFFTTSRISAVEIEGRTHWLCVQEDVTEARHAASALKESRARLELATEAAGLGIWDWDLATNRMTYSPRARMICGFSPEQDITLNDARAVTFPADLPRTTTIAQRALDPAVRAREPYHYRIVRPDGEVRWVLAHGEAVFGGPEGEERALRYVGTLQDVTERVRLEERDRLQKARLALAITAGQMAVWEIDLVTDEVTGSPELNRLLGFPEDASPTAEEMRARYYPGERERMRRLGQEVLARGERLLEVEYRYIWPDGSIRWHLLRAEAQFDASGRPREAVGVLVDVTDRRNAEVRLRQSEERYRQIVEGADDFAIIALDETGIVTSWNPGAEQITGYSEEEAVGGPGDLFFLPDDRAAGAPARELNRAAADGRAVNERWHQRKDGTRFWASGLMMRLDTPGGGYLKMFRDRTAEHEAEAAMRQNEERLRATVLASPFPIMLHAEDGEVLELSRKWTELTGYGRDEIRTHFDWFRLAYPDRFEAICAMMEKEFESEGESAAGEIEIRVRDGATRIWEFFNVGLGRLPDGRRLQISAAADVTGRKATETALRESEARLRALADNIPALCWMAEPDGHIFWFNPRWHEYTGTTAGDQQGWGWQSVHDPAVLPQVVERWQRSLATGEPFEMIFPLRGADGVYRPFLTRVVPLRDESGRIVRWFGTNTDVTEQQRYQRHQRLLINELNHRVKNTLAVVQGLAQQTFRGDDVPLRKRRAFEGRLAALSAAHNLLTRENWDTADLRDVVAQAVHVHDPNTMRFTIDGPPLRVEPKTAVTLAMALHELATNATKYGALSVDGGHVAVVWEIVEGSEPRLSMRWKERGGPTVHPPDHRGFGSRLIERALADELQGHVRLEFLAEGLACLIDAPLPVAREATDEEKWLV